MQYSPSTGGFYDDAFPAAKRPDDVVDVSDGDYAALLAAQDAGQVIQPDDAGRPVAVTPALTADQMAAVIRAARDRRIAATDYLVMPDYPIITEALEAVKAYRQALRDLPTQEGFPWGGDTTAVPWPEMPTITTATSETTEESTAS